jgi:hypothetical protein
MRMSETILWHIKLAHHDMHQKRDLGPYKKIFFFEKNFEKKITL